jgi:hypothetical protein
MGFFSKNTDTNSVETSARQLERLDRSVENAALSGRLGKMGRLARKADDLRNTLSEQTREPW